MLSLWDCWETHVCLTIGRALLSPKTLTLNPKPYLWLRTGQSVLRIDEVCCYTEASAELQHGRLLSSPLVNFISQIGISIILSMFPKLHLVFLQNSICFDLGVWKTLSCLLHFCRCLLRWSLGEHCTHSLLPSGLSLRMA